MNRPDNSKFLLFIEPPKSDRLREPINDKFTNMMERAINNSKRGISNYSRTDEEPHFRQGSGYKGFHLTECGVSSSNNDYLLENGMITNSLAAFYLRYYRNSIPKTEMEKVEELAKFYGIL